MGKARNISKAESRFVNATGDTVSGRLHVNGGAFSDVQTQTNAGVYLTDSIQDGSGWGVGAGIVGRTDTEVWGLGSNGNGVYFGTGQTPEGDNNFQTAWMANSNGVLITPNRPAFLASLTGNVTGSNYVNFLTFGQTGYNIGNHYNVSTGRFTAPVTGVYQFVLKLHCVTNTFMETKIYKNGAEEIRSYDPTGGNSINRTGYAIGQVQLNSGDYVQGVFYDASQSSGTVQGGNDINLYSSTFSGYLIG
jgi:hypothetical protein